MNKTLVGTLSVFSILLFMSSSTASAIRQMSFSFEGVDNDGRIAFEAINVGDEYIDNLTMHIHLWCQTPFTKRINVDMWSDVLVKNLSVGETKHLKTEDPFFRVCRLIHKPFIFYALGELKVVDQNYTCMYIDKIRFILAYYFITLIYEGSYHP